MRVWLVISVMASDGSYCSDDNDVHDVSDKRRVIAVSGAM